MEKSMLKFCLEILSGQAKCVSDSDLTVQAKPYVYPRYLCCPSA